MPLGTKQVPGFPGYYIKTDGSMWSRWKTRRRREGGRGVESYIASEMKEMTLRGHGGGYKTIALRRDGKSHYFLVHRLMLETFVGPQPSPKHECCHRDGNHVNNRIGNLYWGTRQQNMEDMVRHGRTTRGEKDSQAKLTSEDVLVIVDLLNAGEMYKKIAERFGVTAVAIRFIATGKNWGHLTSGLIKRRGIHWSKRPDAADVIARTNATKRRRGLIT